MPLTLDVLHARTNNNNTYNINWTKKQPIAASYSYILKHISRFNMVSVPNFKLFLLFSEMKTYIGKTNIV